MLQNLRPVQLNSLSLLRTSQFHRFLRRNVAGISGFLGGKLFFTDCLSATAYPKYFNTAASVYSRNMSKGSTRRDTPVISPKHILLSPRALLAKQMKATAPNPRVSDEYYGTGGTFKLPQTKNKRNSKTKLAPLRNLQRTSSRDQEPSTLQSIEKQIKILKEISIKTKGLIKQKRASIEKKENVNGKQEKLRKNAQKRVSLSKSSNEKYPENEQDVILGPNPKQGKSPRRKIKKGLLRINSDCKLMRNIEVKRLSAEEGVPNEIKKTQSIHLSQNQNPYGQFEDFKETVEDDIRSSMMRNRQLLEREMKKIDESFAVLESSPKRMVRSCDCRLRPQSTQMKEVFIPAKEEDKRRPAYKRTSSIENGIPITSLLQDESQWSDDCQAANNLFPAKQAQYGNFTDRDRMRLTF